MVGTLKPSIEMLSLPLLPFTLLHSLHSPSLPLLPFAPFTPLHSLCSPSNLPYRNAFTPFTPLCSLNSLDPSLTLTHRWWGIQPSIEIPLLAPICSPSPKFWTCGGVYKALLLLCEWRLGGHCTSRWWGYISTICDHQSFFCHRWWVP